MKKNMNFRTEKGEAIPALKQGVALDPVKLSAAFASHERIKDLLKFS